MKCCLCEQEAVMHIWWGPGSEQFPNGQQGNLCSDHARELWDCMSLPSKERVVVGAPHEEWFGYSLAELEGSPGG